MSMSILSSSMNEPINIEENGYYDDDDENGHYSCREYS